MGGVEGLGDELELHVGDRAPEHAQPERVGRGAQRLDLHARVDELLDPLADRVVGGQVPRGVVGPLRREHHRQPRHLYHARIVGADRLALDHRHPRDPERLARARRAAREQRPVAGARAQLVDDRVHPRGVPPGAAPGLHEDRERRAELDGVDAEIVRLEVQPGELVGVGDPAVGAEQADRLVLDRGDHLLPVGVGVDVAALDDAAGHAGVGLDAAALEVLLPEEVAAELERLVAGLHGPSGGEVPDRDAADLVGVVGHHRGAGGLEGLDGGLGVEQLPVALDRAHDALSVGQRRHAVEIGDDRLDALRSHHRADAAPRGEPRGTKVGVAERDAGEQAEALADGPAEREAHLLAEALVQAPRGLEVAEP